MFTTENDHFLRRTNFVLHNSSSLLVTQHFAFDWGSRLSTVSDGIHSATYNYLANGSLIGQIWFVGPSSMMTTMKDYDHLNRLTSIVNLDSQMLPAASFSYQYNAANQRTAVTNAESCYWVYQYDSLRQVESGKKYWSDGKPVAGQQFECAFHDIGNRKTAGRGGDAFGANLRSQSYSANDLNQYTTRTVPGYVDVLGEARSDATVTLWTPSGAFAQTTRKGDYFRGELPVNNSTGAVWLTITNLGVLQDGANPDIVTNVLGNALVLQSPEAFSFDRDGNLTNDGRWSLTWDAENRLVAMAVNLGTGPQVSMRFEYDSMGRRIRKQVWPNATWAGNPTNDLRFVYDGWNLIATLNDQLSALSSFMWGLDLSGTPQGAGGVGGLLAISDHVQPSTHFVCYDGNGNVAALVNAADGKKAVEYEYGPFGEVIRATGPMAKANPFRFSTKYQDDETSLLYYGYRFYDPSTGRWTSRDPIEEQGGLNVYGFLGNAATDKLDYLGLILGLGRNRHQREIDDVAEILSGLCTDKCMDRCSKCTEKKCKKEAHKIAEAYVHRVYEVRRETSPNTGDRHWGWLCYEWAGLMMESLSKLKLDCWTVRWTGYATPDNGGSLWHNFVFASVGAPKKSGEGPLQDCGKILDPWRNGKPDVWNVGDFHNYNWNVIIDENGVQWYWDGQQWVRANWKIPPSPQF